MTKEAIIKVLDSNCQYIDSSIGNVLIEDKFDKVADEISTCFTNQNTLSLNMHIKIKREDLIEWLNVVNHSLVSNGWEFCGFHNRDYNMVKIRRLYTEGQIHYNEDGFEYKSLYPNVMNTKDYLFFTSKGYKFEVSF